jgi:transcriptional regulator with XRE-family HTH domain
MTLGERIKLRRKELGLTQVQLGKMVHKSSQVVSNWERGYTTAMSPDDLQNIAQALNINVSELMEASSSAQPPAHPVVQGDPVSELFDNPEIRSLARRNFADMSPEEAKAKQKDVMRVVRALFDDED